MSSSSEGGQSIGKSPEFARHAKEYLESGQAQRALEICLEGTAEFPWYGTGALMLGKCYDVLGRTVEAMLAYRRTLKAVPDNPMVQALLKNAEEREQEAFEAYAESQARVLKAKKESTTFESYISEGGEESESSVEFLLRQLQGAKRIVPPAPDAQATEEQPPPLEAPTTRIVTATLAEIYANQGQYREAIKAYRTLLEQRPEEAHRYEKRLADLEELAKMQKNS
jgi:tetratricopeptide (TPR) repeat protein